MILYVEQQLYMYDFRICVHVCMCNCDISYNKTDVFSQDGRESQNFSVFEIFTYSFEHYIVIVFNPRSYFEGIMHSILF